MDTLEIAKQILPPGFTLGEYIPGFIPTRGKSAGKLQNWGYYATDPNHELCILIYCTPNVFTIINPESFEKIRNKVCYSKVRYNLVPFFC